MSVNALYELWLSKVTDAELLGELKAAAGNAEEINDRFFQTLAFGTGGLRGVIGAGTNRMNIYTVGLASQALAAWVLENGKSKSVAIGYDSRIKSDVFARTAAAVLAANGVKVYIYPELVPTPCVSWAVRELGCDSGIVITASHNPAKYNGFKCYAPEGYQMTDEGAAQIEALMRSFDIFDDVKHGDFDKLLAEGTIEYIGQDVMDKFLDAVASASVNPGVCKDSGMKVIYTPLCGTGNKPVRAILSKIGVDDVTVVACQELPDGNFPRAPFPNPEIREAFEASLELTETVPADLLLATDPDCDRVGIAVRTPEGEYKLLSGNETGALMLDYVLSQRKANGTLPAAPLAVKTIVTSVLAEKIAAAYGCELRNVLTGFKYIGEIVTDLEKNGEAERFVMGYEESYGYLFGSHVRDKDAVVASMMICEMAAYYKKAQGKSLLQVLEELYARYGFCRHGLINITFEGESGMKQMAAIMDNLRTNPPAEVAGAAVIGRRDYLNSVAYEADGEKEIRLPKSNVMEFLLADGGAFIARPSGTEPKIKFYLTAVEATDEAALDRIAVLDKAVREIVG